MPSLCLLRNQVSERRSPLEQQALTRIRLDVIVCESHQTLSQRRIAIQVFLASCPPSSFALGFFMDLLPRTLDPLALHSHLLPRVRRFLSHLRCGSDWHAARAPTGLSESSPCTFVRHYVPPVVSVRLDFRRRPHCAFSPPDDFVWLSYVAEFEQLPHSSALPRLYRYRRLSGRWAFSHEFHFPLQALPSLLEQPLRTKCVS
jgi:hypothetical protein